MPAWDALGMASSPRPLAALAGTPLSTPCHGLHAPLPHPSCPPPCPASLSSLLPTAPCSSHLCLLPSLLPPLLQKPPRGGQRRGFSLQGLLAAGALVASCTAKCLFGMQSREQPPAPPSPSRAPCQWASVCEAKLQSSPGDDLPVPYSRWLQAESTPLPRSPAPRHVRRRWLFLPAPAGQRHPQSPSQRGDTMGVILCSAQIKSQLRAQVERRRPDQLFQENFVRSRVGMPTRPPGTTSVCP